MNLENRVRQYISDNQLLQSGASVIVGLSGGADSTALLRILLALGYRCIAVHCNFHLRGAESDRDRQFVTDLCQNLGVELIVCNYDTVTYASQKNISIEMAARELRYADFERIMQEHAASAVCIAHHRDDSVETLLLNLIRGTGLRVYCRSHFPQVYIFRQDCLRKNNCYIVIFNKSYHIFPLMQPYYSSRQ